MPLIELETLISAPAELVFDLARSVDLHTISTSSTKEKAVAGKTKGLMELQESVTWEARHLGLTQRLTSQITSFDRPHHFIDEMIKGIFKSFHHEHHFNPMGNKTLMKDLFEYHSPWGTLGKIADNLFLKNYMKAFLTSRNRIIKEYAESDLWRLVLKDQNINDYHD